MPAITGTCEFAVFSRLMIGRRVISITPERCTAADTTSAVAMITTTSEVKPVNASFRLHQPQQHPDQERRQRHEVVAEPAPGEHRHRAADHGEGQSLLQRHASPPERQANVAAGAWLHRMPVDVAYVLPGRGGAC